jgi:hypothetical protein
MATRWRGTAFLRTIPSSKDSSTGWACPKASNTSKYPRESVEDFLLFWLETGYDPEDYSQEQLDELDKLTERWVKDHERRPKLAKRR